MIEGNAKINAKVMKLPIAGLHSLANYYKSSNVFALFQGSEIDTHLFDIPVPDMR